MKKSLILLSLFTFVGCGTPPPKPIEIPQFKLTGKKVVRALSNIQTEQKAKLKKSIVYVEITTSNRGGNIIRNGVVINDKNYILFPLDTKKEDITKIKVWVGDDEYEGKFLESQSRGGLGLTLVKILELPKDTVKPLNYRIKSNDLKPGSMLFSYAATGEQYNFDIFHAQSSLMATLPSVYDRMLFMNNMGYFTGAPVIDVNGNWVGMFQQNAIAYLLIDLEDRIDTLIEKADDPNKDSNEKKKQPWAGFYPEVINEDYAKLKNLPKSGIWVRSVFKDSPAHKAGLMPGDLIVKVNQRDIRGKNSNALNYFNKLMKPKIGRDTELTFLRKGETKSTKVTFIKEPERDLFEVKDIGITVQKITDMAYQNYDLNTRKGVLITNVESGSPAATSSGFGSPLLDSGEVILEINGKTVTDLEGFKKIIRDVLKAKTQVVLFKLKKGRYYSYEAVNLKLNNDGKNNEGVQ